MAWMSHLNKLIQNSKLLKFCGSFHSKTCSKHYVTVYYPHICLLGFRLEDFKDTNNKRKAGEPHTANVMPTTRLLFENCSYTFADFFWTKHASMVISLYGTGQRQYSRGASFWRNIYSTLDARISVYHAWTHDWKMPFPVIRNILAPQNILYVANNLVFSDSAYYLSYTCHIKT